ncbi:MAG: caspase family protein, partial [Spirochaetales bacterium]
MNRGPLSGSPEKQKQTKIYRSLRSSLVGKAILNLIQAFLLTLLLIGIIGLASCSLDPDPGERYALVYGVSQYVEPNNQLLYSARDAEDVGNLLIQGGYPADNVRVRLNADATKDQLEADIEWVAGHAKKDSLFLFYFSGHGLQIKPSDSIYSLPTGEYIFLYHPQNTLQLGGVKDSDLMQLIAKIPSRRKGILVDACNSGGFIGDFPGVEGLPP